MHMYCYERLEWALCKAAKFLEGRDLVEYITKAEEVIDTGRNPFALQRELELIASTRKTDMGIGQDNAPNFDDAAVA